MLTVGCESPVQHRLDRQQCAGTGLKAQGVPAGGNPHCFSYFLLVGSVGSQAQWYRWFGATLRGLWGLSCNWCHVPRGHQLCAAAQNRARWVRRGSALWAVGGGGETFVNSHRLCNIFLASVESFVTITTGYTEASYGASAFVLLTVSFIPSQDSILLHFS